MSDNNLEQEIATKLDEWEQKVLSGALQQLSLNQVEKMLALLILANKNAIKDLARQETYRPIIANLMGIGEKKDADPSH